MSTLLLSSDTSEEGIGSDCRWFCNHVELPCSSWELNSGPLEEQSVLLTAEPSLQPLDGTFLEPEIRMVTTGVSGEEDEELMFSMDSHKDEEHRDEDDCTIQCDCTQCCQAVYLKKVKMSTVVDHCFNSSTQEAEAGRLAQL